MKNLFKKEWKKFVVVCTAIAMLLTAGGIVISNAVTDNSKSKGKPVIDLPVETEEPVIIETIEPYTIIFGEGVFDGYPLSEVINVQETVKNYIMDFCCDKCYETVEVFDAVKDYEYNSYSVHILYGDDWYQCVSVESDYSEPLVLYNTKYTSWVLNEYN